MPSVPASSSRTTGSAMPRSRTARTTAGPAPSSHRLELPQPMIAIMPRGFQQRATKPSNPPQPAPPVGVYRHRQLGQISPLGFHQVVHAFHAAHPVGPLVMIDEAADD